MICRIDSDTIQLVVFLAVIFTVIMVAQYRTKKWTTKTLGVMCADSVLLCYAHGHPEFVPKSLLGSELDAFMNHLKQNGVEADLSPDKEEVFLRKGEMSSIVKVYY